MRGMRSIVLLSCFVLTACGVGESDEMPYLNHDPGVLTQDLNAGQAGGCSTTIVQGLSDQLIEELNCISPNLLVDFSASWAHIGSGVNPFLAPSAKNALQ